MTRRMYVAAYRAENGNVIAMTPPNCVRRFAEADAESMRSPEDQTEVFVAYQDVPDWTPCTDSD
jgi:hypothetical protein